MGASSEIASPVSWSTFTENIRIWKKISMQCREGIGALANGVKVSGECSETDLHVGRMSADVLEDILIVEVLLVPFDVVIEAKIVAD